MNKKTMLNKNKVEDFKKALDDWEEFGGIVYLDWEIRSKLYTIIHTDDGGIIYDLVRDIKSKKNIAICLMLM